MEGKKRKLQWKEGERTRICKYYQQNRWYLKKKEEN